jgi:chromosome segregation ATPase
MELNGTPDNVVAMPPQSPNVPERPALTNPNLGASLNSDYEALRNDMEQATELAAELQRKLSEKSNDFALLKQVFEKSRTDLATLNANVIELRKERHRLANEAMRVLALEMELKVAARERDQSQAELQTLRESLAHARDQTGQHTQKSDAIIAQLAGRVAALKGQLAAVHQLPRPTPVREAADPAVKAVVATISDAVERLKELLGPGAAPQQKPARPLPAKERIEEHIDISYGA